MIRQRRISLGLGLQPLAAQLEISTAALSRYERGKRLWPPALYAKAQAALGLKSLARADLYWSWNQHREWWDSWEVETDPGQTWADLDRETVELFRQVPLANQPPLEFRSNMRADSKLEAGGYGRLCAGGAVPAYVSLVAMNFPHHPLINDKRKPMSLARRAALILDNWIIWPQVNLLINGRKVRVDLLAYNGKRWIALELDGRLHETRTALDLRRDEALGFPVIRFQQTEVLNANFAALVRARLNGLPE